MSAFVAAVILVLVMFTLCIHLFNTRMNSDLRKTKFTHGLMYRFTENTHTNITFYECANPREKERVGEGERERTVKENLTSVIKKACFVH